MKKQTTEEIKRDRRKADYTDRPLTETEKEFAARPENYNLFLRYMKVRRLDPEEWYDILVFHYLRLVKKYLMTPKMQEYDFAAVLFATLDHRKSDYFRDMNRMKRIPQNCIISLDWEKEDENNDKGKVTAPMFWVDTKQSVERTVLFREMVSEILSNLDNEQTEIFIRIFEEYGKEEIRKDLEIGTWVYRKQLKEIKRVVADYLSM